MRLDFLAGISELLRESYLCLENVELGFRIDDSQPGDHMADYTIVLKHREEVAEETMAFRFDIAGTGYTFKAGQNAAFTLLDPPETDMAGNTRTLSFASSPNDLSLLTVAM